MDTKEEIEELHIQEFRYIIQKIKKSIIQNKTLKSQNISDLKNVLEPELNKLFLLLRPIIEHYKSIDTIPDEDLKNLFYRTLQEYPRTPTYQNDLIYYLHRDLIEYPLIIDNTVIDEYDKFKKNKVNSGIPNLIENNSDLTIE